MGRGEASCKASERFRRDNPAAQGVRVGRLRDSGRSQEAMDPRKVESVGIGKSRKDLYDILHRVEGGTHY